MPLGAGILHHGHVHTFVGFDIFWDKVPGGHELPPRAYGILGGKGAHPLAHVMQELLVLGFLNFVDLLEDLLLLGDVEHLLVVDVLEDHQRIREHDQE